MLVCMKSEVRRKRMNLEDEKSLKDKPKSVGIRTHGQSFWSGFPIRFWREVGGSRRKRGFGRLRSAFGSDLRRCNNVPSCSFRLV